MPTEKLKINDRTQKKNLDQSTRWKPKNSHELRLIRPETRHKNPEHLRLKIRNISNTICEENCESSSWVQASLLNQEI